MKVIESYIINVDKLRYRLKVRELELLEQGDIFYHVDSYSLKLKKIINVIEDVYNNSDDNIKEIFYYKYWEPNINKSTWDDFAKGFCCSKTSVLRMRYKYLTEIADRIDFISGENPRDLKETQEKNERYISKKLRFDVLNRDKFKCVYCGSSPKEDGVKLQIDHIIPLSKGGGNNIENLVSSCLECNIGKSDKELGGGFIE